MFPIECVASLQIRGAHSCCWDSDGNFLTESLTRRVDVWNTRDWRQIGTLRPDIKFNGFTNFIEFSPDGSYFARIDENRKMTILNVENNNEIASFGDEQFERCCWNPKLCLLATIGPNDPRVKVWDTSTWGCIATLAEHSLCIDGATWNVAGTQLATASKDNSVKIWGWVGERLECIKTLVHPMGPNSTAYKCIWSPDGKYLASLNLGDTVHIWNLETGEHVARLQHQNSDTDDHRIVQCIWSPIGTLLATVGHYGTVNIWSAQTGACISRIEGKYKDNRGCCWNPSGDLLLTLDNDNRPKISDPQTGACLALALPGQFHETGITRFAWHPNGKFIATAGGTKVKVWKTPYGVNCGPEILTAVLGDRRSRKRRLPPELWAYIDAEFLS